MRAARAVPALLVALLLGASMALAQGGADSTAARSPKNTCLVCHLELDSPEAAAFRTDIHYARGLTCADCHGGDPSSDDQDESMSKARGFIGVPMKQDIPRLCGKCHGPAGSELKTRFKLDDVLTAFRGSIHGRALQSSPAGPQCVSCHGVHNIARVDQPRSPVHPGKVVDTCARCHANASYMRDFNPTLPVDQREKYLTSVHGKRHAAGDWKVATCVSCHSNHLILDAKDPRAPVYPANVPSTCAHCHANERTMAGYGIPTTQYRDYKQSVHGVALLKKADLNAPACNSCHGNHGAAPPGAASVIAVCGQCHQANEELYEKSAHRPVFERGKLPGCVVCHGNHLVHPPSDETVSFSATSPCGKCHRNNGTDKAAPGIVRIRGLLDSLNVGQKDAEGVLSRAENLGMDVSDARYSLKDVHQAEIQSRVAIHTFQAKDVEEAARPGITLVAQAHKAGLDAIQEYRFRRTGLGISTLIVTCVVILLYLKIRAIERRQRGEDQ